MRSLCFTFAALIFVTSLGLEPRLWASSAEKKCAQLLSRALPFIKSGPVTQWKWSDEESAADRITQDSGVLIESLISAAAKDPQAASLLFQSAQTRRLSERDLLLLVRVLQALAEGEVAQPFREANQSYGQADFTFANRAGQRLWEAETRVFRVHPESRLRALQSLAWIVENLSSQIERRHWSDLVFWMNAIALKLLSDPHFGENVQSSNDEGLWRDRMLFAVLDGMGRFALSNRSATESRAYIHDAVMQLRELLMSQENVDHQLDHLLRQTALFAKVPDLIPASEDQLFRMAFRNAVASQSPRHLRTQALQEMSRILDRYFFLGIRWLHQVKIQLEEKRVEQFELDPDLSLMIKETVDRIDGNIGDAILAFELWVHGVREDQDLEKKIFKPNLHDKILKVLFEALEAEDYSDQVAELIRSRWERDDDGEERVSRMRSLVMENYDFGMHRLKRAYEKSFHQSHNFERAILVLEELRLPVGLMSLRNHFQEVLNAFEDSRAAEIEWMLHASTEELLQNVERMASIKEVNPHAFLNALIQFLEVTEPPVDEGSLRSFEESAAQSLVSTSLGFPHRYGGLPVRFDDSILARFEHLASATEMEMDEDPMFVGFSTLQYPSGTWLERKKGFEKEIRRYATVFALLLEAKWDIQGQAFAKAQWRYLMELYRQELLKLNSSL